MSAGVIPRYSALAPSWAIIERPTVMRWVYVRAGSLTITTCQHVPRDPPDLYPGLDHVQWEDGGPEAEPGHAPAHHSLRGREAVLSDPPQSAQDSPGIT